MANASPKCITSLHVVQSAQPPSTQSDEYISMFNVVFVLPLSSISQQQNFWFNHQPVEQYPNFISDNQSVTIAINAELRPIAAPRGQ